MQDVFRTVIIPISLAEIAGQIASVFSTGGAPLSPGLVSTSGGEPPEWIISTGGISAQFAALIPLQDHDGNPISAGEPDELLARCVEAGLTITAAEIAALFSAADVTTQDPHQVLNRLGLKLIQSTNI
jgi:hypothetical protein